MNSQSFNNVSSAFGKGLPLPNKSRDGGLPSLFRMRLKFLRLGQARNLSHLEQIRELRRMVKASNLPYVIVRCGKIQIPRMSFGPAISMGYESLAEYADLYLSRSEGLREVFDSLHAVSEKGISVLSVKKIPLHFPSIEALVNVAEYEISGEAIRNCNDEIIKRFLERSEITVAKNKPGGRSYLIDAKPLIISMKLKNSSTAPSASGEGLRLPDDSKDGRLPSALGESGAPAPTPRMVCGGMKTPTGMAVEGGAGEGLPVPNKSKDAVLHLMLRFGPKRNIKPERIIDLLMKGHTSSEGISQRFYSPVLQVARKELYWENSSGQLVTP